MQHEGNKYKQREKEREEGRQKKREIKGSVENPKIVLLTTGYPSEIMQRTPLTRMYPSHDLRFDFLFTVKCRDGGAFAEGGNWLLSQHANSVCTVADPRALAVRQRGVRQYTESLLRIQHPARPARWTAITSLGVARASRTRTERRLCARARYTSTG